MNYRPPKPVPFDHFGSSAERIKFLNHLRSRHSLTYEDLAKKSHYKVDTVKAWFSTTDARRRPCSDRALRCLLANMHIEMAQYWEIVRQG